MAFHGGFTSEETPIRVGIVGVGFQTRGIFMPCLSVMTGVELTALASNRKETASAAEKKFKVPCYVGWQKLVNDPNVDAVLVATPSPMLVEVASAALENDKHVFIETMGIMTPEGGARLRKLEEDTGKVIQFGYSRVYAPIYVKMKDILKEWRQRDPGPRLWLLRYYYGEHLMIHLLIYMNGFVQTVQGSGGERGEAYLYEFENGDVASVAFTKFVTMMANMERLEVSSPRAAMAANNVYELRFLGDLSETYGYESRFDSLSETVWNPSFSAPYFSMSSQYLHGTQPELEAFLKYIRHGGRPSANVDTVEHTMYVKRAAREALATGEKIVIKDYIAAHRPT
jgi:predicted dehydrogenase